MIKTGQSKKPQSDNFSLLITDPWALLRQNKQKKNQNTIQHATHSIDTVHLNYQREESRVSVLSGESAPFPLQPLQGWAVWL